MKPDPDNPSNRWWVLGLIMLGTFMAILDTSIVNVALPDMMSAFGVNRDQIEWVSNAFMLATAVAMPLVGWVVGKVGYKALYAASLLLFTLGSAACALAWSFDALIGARVLQAVGGGAIQPVGMAIITEMFEPHERGRALGIWGTGIMAGPAAGPVLGGYLTQWFGWRSIFSVNLPFGVIGVILTLIVMHDSEDDRKSAPLDTWGFVFLSVALIAGLLGLSNGQQKGWDSDYVLICTTLTVIGLVMFLAVETAVEHPLIDLKLFKIRNFTLGMVLAVFRSVGLFGSVFLLPLFLERLSGYTTIDTGLWLMPGAVAVGLIMPLAGRWADRYHPALLVTVGTLITAVSMFMRADLDPQSSAMVIVMPQVTRGVGLALMMAPLLTATLNVVPREHMATASSFLNITQRVGGAFGVAVLNTYVTDVQHHHAVKLGSLLPAQSTHFAHATASASRLALYHATGVAVSPGLKPMLMAVETFMKRATVLAYQDGFVFGGVIVFAGVPLSMLLHRAGSRKRGGAQAAGKSAEPEGEPPLAALE